jgi:hypothetical protein
MRLRRLAPCSQQLVTECTELAGRASQPHASLVGATKELVDLLAGELHETSVV